MRTNLLRGATSDSRAESSRGTKPRAGVGRHFRMLSLAMLVMLLIGLVPINGSMFRPQSVEASHYDADSEGWWDYSGKHVYVKATVHWYKYNFGLRIKGVYARDSYVILNKQGCLWVRTSWNNVDVNVTWPPSGSANTVSDGYYRTCGEAGTYIWLDGINYTSARLTSVTTCIGFSYYGTYELRRFDSCHKYMAGYK